VIAARAVEEVVEAGAVVGWLALGGVLTTGVLGFGGVPTISASAVRSWVAVLG
jgi:hypothetical protein